MLTIIIFSAFVLFTLGLSTYLGRKAKSASGYFAAHGEVGWFVNGIAFAGDYLSAASFLGICGMIAFYGFDGFLYSIGFLAGWVVALFVIAEPIKKLGKFTFADALSAKFGNSPGITLAAAISTLVVSIFYLIPQMVGAGSLIKPLLSLPDLNLGLFTLPAHSIGVILVGAVVITIVTTAGMVSTTWVQFIKGSLLVVFCLGLVVGILNRGIPSLKSEYRSSVQAPQPGTWTPSGVAISDARILEEANLKLTSDFFNMQSVGPFEFITQLGQSEILKTTRIAGPKSTGGDANQQPLTINVTQANRGESYLLPGGYFKGIRSDNLVDRLDFASLMLALFCGTAALPHILIRYYTVKDAAAARKSTVVGIIAIGFFYILTLYIGLGAMVSGNLDPADSNMAAPLLAKTFGEVPFAIISAIAFTTVLGTVSGLILAASGAVAQDLLTTVRGVVVSDRDKVRSAKIASVVVGVVAIVLGIVFKNFSAAFLVGWAFNIAASANLPAIVMILFWRGTTRQGIIASIVVGLLSSLIWLSLTKEAMLNIYNNFGATFTAADAIAPFSQPGLVTIPLAFIVLIIVSLMTRSRTDRGFDVSARQ